MKRPPNCKRQKQKLVHQWVRFGKDGGRTANLSERVDVGVYLVNVVADGEGSITDCSDLVVVVVDDDVEAREKVGIVDGDADNTKKQT